MASLNVSKDMIINIAEQENKKYIKLTNQLVNNVLALAIEDLSQKISFISIKNAILQPANELVSGGFIDGSNFVYLLGIKNVQLELNTSRKLPFLQNLKERFKWAWANRQPLFYRKRKRKKRKKDTDNSVQNIKFDVNKYSIYNLAEDLQKAIANHISETSIISLNGNILKLIGKDDFGANTKIVVYVVSFDGVNYKFYAGKKRGYINLDINKRVDKLNQKISLVGENFIKILKIFNALYFNTNGTMCNQIFLESILCSCPDELYEGEDIYKAFVKLVNHISFNPLKEIKSINNDELSIYEDIVCGDCVVGFRKMLNKLFVK